MALGLPPSPLAPGLSSGSALLQRWASGHLGLGFSELTYQPGTWGQDTLLLAEERALGKGLGRKERSPDRQGLGEEERCFGKRTGECLWLSLGSQGNLLTPLFLPQYLNKEDFNRRTDKPPGSVHPMDPAQQHKGSLSGT